MRQTILGAALAGALVTFGSGAWAFNCPVDFKVADEAIASATVAMKALSDKQKMGLVHTVIDDAKMLLASGQHNHAKPAAGALDHARGIGKARAAVIEERRVGRRCST